MIKFDFSPKNTNADISGLH